MIGMAEFWMRMVERKREPFVLKKAKVKSPSLQYTWTWEDGTLWVQ